MRSRRLKTPQTREENILRYRRAREWRALPLRPARVPVRQASPTWCGEFLCSRRCAFRFCAITCPSSLSPALKQERNGDVSKGKGKAQKDGKQRHNSRRHASDKGRIGRTRTRKNNKKHEMSHRESRGPRKLSSHLLTTPPSAPRGGVDIAATRTGVVGAWRRSRETSAFAVHLAAHVFWFN